MTASTLAAPDLSKANLELIFQEATIAANTAGAAWMAKAAPKYGVYDSFSGNLQGTMLDLCGNAHVVVKDKRSAFFRACKKHGFFDTNMYSCTMPIHHEWKHRQEHGLQLACAKAAIKVLNDHNIYAVKIWDYID